MTEETYLHIIRRNPTSAEPDNEYFEIGAANSVTRHVLKFDDRLENNSIAIMSSRSGGFGDYAYSATHPCLFGGNFPLPDDLEHYWTERDCQFETITKAIFQKLFMSARPRA